MTLGNCFAAAGEYLLSHCLFDLEKREQLRLVHGRVTRRLPPHIQYGHAWIEVDGKDVIDPVQNLAATIEDYYEAGGVDAESCIKYTYADMGKHINETKHWGPWKLKELPEESEYRESLGESHG